MDPARRLHLLSLSPPFSTQVRDRGPGPLVSVPRFPPPFFFLAEGFPFSSVNCFFFRVAPLNRQAPPAYSKFSSLPEVAPGVAFEDHTLVEVPLSAPEDHEVFFFCVVQVLPFGWVVLSLRSSPGGGALLKTAGSDGFPLFSSDTFFGAGVIRLVERALSLYILAPLPPPPLRESVHFFPDGSALG